FLDFVNQNNKYESWAYSFFDKSVHMNIHGDPTLELLVTDPPINVSKQEMVDNVLIKWENSESEFYNVYFAESLESDKIKLNDEFITGNEFITELKNGIYIVKSVKLEETNSASYWQESIGVIAE
ncbi:hypothetical protein OAQ99_07695, partial [Candidatus Kapabacteria bacterium]|nr:hypothetical protein [Candidatus Kapabacteria bacterium]